MVINVRGPNGCGKSTLIRQLLKEFDHAPVKNEAGKIRGYAVDTGHPQQTVRATGCPRLARYLYIVGRYETDCGGCDTIKTQQEIKDTVFEFWSRLSPYVIFEGIMVSTIFKPYLELSRKVDGMIWAFIDTPPEVCLERIQQRNGGKPINHVLFQKKLYDVKRCKASAQAAGERVVTLDWEQPYASLKATLRGE